MKIMFLILVLKLQYLGGDSSVKSGMKQCRESITPLKQKYNLLQTTLFYYKQLNNESKHNVNNLAQWHLCGVTIVNVYTVYSIIGIVYRGTCI